MGEPKIVHASTGGWGSIEHLLGAILAKVGGEVTLTDDDLRRASHGTVKILRVEYETFPHETHCFVELDPPKQESNPEGGSPT